MKSEFDYSVKKKFTDLANTSRPQLRFDQKKQELDKDFDKQSTGKRSQYSARSFKSMAISRRGLNKTIDIGTM
jgi:hypothetical protein